MLTSLGWRIFLYDPIVQRSKSSEASDFQGLLVGSDFQGLFSQPKWPFALPQPELIGFASDYNSRASWNMTFNFLPSDFRCKLVFLELETPEQEKMVHRAERWTQGSHLPLYLLEFGSGVFLCLYMRAGHCSQDSVQ